MAKQTKAYKYKTKPKAAKKPVRANSRSRWLQPKFLVLVLGILLVGAIGTYLQFRGDAFTPTYSMTTTRDRLTQCRSANVVVSLQASAPASGSMLRTCTIAVQNLLAYYNQTKPNHAVPIDGWYQAFDAEKVSSYKYYRMGISGSQIVDYATYTNMISYMNGRITTASASQSTTTSTTSTYRSGSKPNADNTGVPAGRSLTVPTTNTTKGITVASNGNVTITKSGTFENMRIKGRLTVKANSVIIRYSRIEANPSPWDLSREPTSTADCKALGSQKTAQIVTLGSGYSGLTIEDSDLIAARPSVWVDNGINGSNYILRRVDISRTVDGAGIYSTSSTNVTVEGSYIHDLYYGLYDPGHSCGPTHSDGIQVHYGSNTIIRNNTILARSNGGVKLNASIQVNQNGGRPTSNLTIDGNWMDYGTCTVNVWDNNLGAIKGFRLTNNKYGKNAAKVVNGEPCAMVVETTTKDSTSNSYGGNTWENGTTPTPTVRNAGT